MQSFLCPCTLHGFIARRHFAGYNSEINVVHVSLSISITLLLILNGTGVPGRLVPALLADHYFGALDLLIPSVFSAGLLLYC